MNKIKSIKNFLNFHWIFCSAVNANEFARRTLHDETLVKRLKGSSQSRISIWPKFSLISLVFLGPPIDLLALGFFSYNMKTKNATRGTEPVIHGWVLSRSPAERNLHFVFTRRFFPFLFSIFSTKKLPYFNRIWSNVWTTKSQNLRDKNGILPGDIVGEGSEQLFELLFLLLLL